MNNFLSGPSEQTMSIGALSERTGVPTTTLRSWETRYGFPVAIRRDGGHRRYSDDQVDLVLDVIRRRAAGASIASAIDAARLHLTPVDHSFYAALTGPNDGLRPSILRKPALSALTAALEDECMAQAQRPVLFGAFQRAKHYRASGARWNELARTAAGTAVFADFTGDSPTEQRLPAEVPLASDSPVLREWVLVCDAPGFTASVAGWELPSSPTTLDKDRRFETVWTVDPQAVRRATHVGLRLVGEVDPALSERLEASLPEAETMTSPALLRANSFFNRVVDYLSAATEQAS